MQHEEPLLDGWLPMTPLEVLEMEIRAQWAHYDQLRADINDLKARVAEIERQRARDNED